jgi:hypothetical protein
MTEQQRQSARNQLGLLDSVSRANFSELIKTHEQNILWTFEHLLDKIVIDKNTYQPLVEDFKQCLIYNFDEDET